jgi:hypothetical protein
MKRALAILALTMLVLLLLPIRVAGQGTPLNYLTRTMLQAGTWNFSRGLSVVSGQRINLEGSAGDSYLIWDATNQQVQVYVNGSLRARINHSGVIPGDCPADVYSMETGTECYRPTTGQLIAVTSSGPAVVSGSTP